MTQDDPSSIAAAPEGVPHESPLRIARERCGVDQASLAGKLKISVARLEALEQGRYEEFSDPVFVRSLALSVCRHLNVDATEVLAHLPKPEGRTLEKIGRGLQTPFRDRTVRWHSVIDASRLKGLVLVASMVLIVVLVALAVNHRSGVSIGASASAASSSAVPSSAAASAPSVSSSSATVETVFAEAAVETFPGLVITTQEASWVEVLDGQGKEVLSKVVQPSESLKISADLPLRLKIGNAKATQVFFKGQAVDFSGTTRDNVARVELN